METCSTLRRDDARWGLRFSHHLLRLVGVAWTGSSRKGEGWRQVVHAAEVIDFAFVPPNACHTIPLLPAAAAQ